MVRKARYLLLVASVVVSFLLSVGTAVAQSTVWDAVKQVVPASTVGVVRINVAALRSTSLFARFAPALLAKERDVKDTLDAVKRLCNIDVVNKLDEVVVAGQNNDKAGVYIKIRDVNESKATACFIAVAKSIKEVVTAKRTDNIVEYTMSGSAQKKIYVGWLTPDVAVIASDTSDRSLLASMMQKTTTGFMASADTRKALSSVDMNGIAWGVMNYVAQLTSSATTKGGYGSISSAAGTLSTKVTVRLSSAKQATTFAAEANKQLAETLKQQLPPAVANIARTAKITASGDAVLFAAAASEADLGTLITFLLGS